MVIKDKFKLLKDIPNVLKLSSSSLRSHRITEGRETLQIVLNLLQKKVDHYTKKKVYKLLNDKKKNYIEVVYISTYSLPVAYNKTTDQILINLSAFATREITAMNPTSKDLYGCLVYGICLRELMNKKPIPTSFAPHITAFLLSVFIRVFGKEYGLLGKYSTQIPKLKFIISCYVYSSFFNITGSIMIRNSSIGLAYNFKEDLDKLNSYDFSNTYEFIKALDELKVFPGINKYNFVKKVLTILTIHFIPAIEDCSRFMAVLTTSMIPGITPALSPSFYYRYNETVFNTIIKYSERIFK